MTTLNESDMSGWIRIIELRREIENEEQNPLLRITEVIRMLRDYRAAVIRANVPRHLAAASASASGNREMFLAYREAERLGTPNQKGLELLRQKLTTLDCNFIIGSKPCHQIRFTDWETSVWRPISSWAVRGYEMLFPGPRPAGWPTCVDNQVLERWESELEQLETALELRKSQFLPPQDDPVADETTFSVRWQGRTCILGNTDGFRLIQRFIKANGRNVSHTDIAEMLGDDRMECSTIRKAVWRLREKLRKGGLRDLCDAIFSERGYFRLDVSGTPKNGNGTTTNGK